MHVDSLADPFLLWRLKGKREMIHLHFVHGFLGLPADWGVFKEKFAPYKCYFHPIELYLPNASTNYFHDWACKFNEINKPAVEVNISHHKNILIGYSLGGRLALHCLLQINSFWDAAIIISANPGLVDEKERKLRLKNDELWAEQFLTQDWSSLLKDWNSQVVFGEKLNPFERKECNFNRDALSKIMNVFSLGRQENLRREISKLSTPVLWITGELDLKFSKIAKEIKKLNKNIDVYIVPKVGHRVPWEDTNQFAFKALNFISKPNFYK